jgi:hypothetical protein
MKLAPTSGGFGRALRICEAAAAALCFIIGVSTVRGLIGLARMMPMRPAAERRRGASQTADGDPGASRRRTGSS